MNKTYLFLLYFLPVFTLPSFAAQVDPSNEEKVSELILSTTKRLAEISNNDTVIDALYEHSSQRLFLSKQGDIGDKSVILSYQVDFDHNFLGLKNRQEFDQDDASLIKNRDGIFAFFPYSVVGNVPGNLQKLENDNFVPFYDLGRIKVFPNHLKTTLNSNFIASVDFPEAPLSLARVRISTIDNDINSPSKLKLQAYTNIQNQRQSDASGQLSNIFGEITAMAMSPMARIKDPNTNNDIPANRLIGVAHSIANEHKLHLWYFPSIQNDFVNSKGHKVFVLNDKIDNIVFSPTTFGLVMASHKNEGRITVMRMDWQQKERLLDDTLGLESSTDKSSDPTALIFGPKDEIIAAINHSLYLFTVAADGKYTQKDVERINFMPDEKCIKILNHENNFIAVGSKGSIQMGSFEKDNYNN